MEQPGPTTTHLHQDDVPDTLAVLQAVLQRRLDRDEPVAGYERTDGGAFVEWTALCGENGLSSTEVACVHIARGLATLERSGGPAPRMHGSLATAFGHVLRDVDRTAGTFEILRRGPGGSTRTR